MKRYYIAYGSNLHKAHMAARCPDATAAGTAILEGRELLFKGCATVEPRAGMNTPVGIWEISEADEKRLDVYEGWPVFYRKEELEVELFPAAGGELETVKAMVYIMNDGHELRAPFPDYYAVIQQGFLDFGFPIRVLNRALRASVGRDEADRFLRRGGFIHGR